MLSAPGKWSGWLRVSERSDNCLTRLPSIGVCYLLSVPPERSRPSSASFCFRRRPRSTTSYATAAKPRTSIRIAFSCAHEKASASSAKYPPTIARMAPHTKIGIFSKGSNPAVIASPVTVVENYYCLLQLQAFRAIDIATVPKGVSAAPATSITPEESPPSHAPPRPVT